MSLALLASAAMTVLATSTISAFAAPAVGAPTRLTLADADPANTIVVTAQRSVAEVQVSTTSQVIKLSNLSVFDTPLATSSSADQLIREQLARSISDIAADDPAVRAANSRYGESDGLMIRDFLVYAGVSIISHFEDWLRRPVESAALEPVLHEWQPSFGPFLCYHDRRLVPPVLRTVIDFIRAMPA